MLFSSLIFLQLFLPLTLLLYYGAGLLPHLSDGKKRQLKNGVLLFASLIFYGFNGLKYLLLMFAVITVNYLGGLLVSRPSFGPAARKRSLVLAVAVNLGILFYFKYFNMFRDILQDLSFLFTGRDPQAFVRVLLPVGISFYIFQGLSYVNDVYRQDTPPQKNILTFALFISCFPQLIAGPIVQYADVSAQLTDRRENGEQFAEGIRRFLYGLGKKVIIANTLAEVADPIWDLDISGIGAGLAWMAGLAYFFQIYYDFSGYSDMAIGLGKMFGLDFLENFRYPYLSESITEFWRRWHISLGTWFRKYVYIPLGGNRKGEARTLLNLIIVFALTGIWHGANWTFFFWGLYHVFWMILERLVLKEKLQGETGGIHFLNRLYAFLVVFIGWIFFRADSLPDAFCFIGQLFSFSAGDENVLSFLTLRVLLVFAAAVLGAGWIQRKIGDRAKTVNARRNRIPERVYLILLLLACIVMLTNANYNPFIYFQF